MLNSRTEVTIGNKKKEDDEKVVDEKEVIEVIKDMSKKENKRTAVK